MGFDGKTLGILSFSQQYPSIPDDDDGDADIGSRLFVHLQIVYKMTRQRVI